MKLSVKILIFVCLILNISKVYVDDITDYSNKTNIEKTVLIEKYLIDHKNKIEKFAEKYNMEEDIDLKENLERINYLINSLNKIQANDIWYNNEKLAINTILNEIKSINEELKILLKKKKDIVEEKIDRKLKQYSEIWIKISKKLDEMSEKINKKYIKWKSPLSLKESKIKKSLEGLNEVSKNLKNFSHIKFSSEEEIQTSFLRILKKIKIEVQTLKIALN